MTRLVITGILLINTAFVMAQTDVVITLQGDSITGKASISNIKEYSDQTITLKNERDKEHFKVYEIKSLLRGDEVYHTINLNGRYQLGLLIKEGYLSIYKFMDSEITSSNDFSTTVLVKKDGSQLEVPNIGFKKMVNKFLIDCDVTKKGFEENTYKKSDLEKIVDDYNNCISENTESINAEQNLALNKKIDSDKDEQISALITKIKADGNIAETDTIVEMLNDLKDKFKEGDNIPTYLVNALRDALKNSPELTKQLNLILK